MENPKSELKFKKIPGQNILLGIDIGGSLSKISIVTANSEKETIRDILKEYKHLKELETNDFILNLLFFKSSDIIPLLKKINNIYKINQIYTTGGGAYKYYQIIKSNFKNIEFLKCDELKSLVNGYIFMNEYKLIYKIENYKKIFVPSNDLIYPHITVNIGSGVSILKVSSPKDISRVTGTIMGGGTLIGLSKILIGIDNYDEILNLAQKGNLLNIDLFDDDFHRNKNNNHNYQKNIQNENKNENENKNKNENKNDENKNENENENDENDDNDSLANGINLKSEIPVSSFGKVFNLLLVDKKKFKKEDIAVSLLNLICLHITHIASIVAKKDKIDTIYFYGNFTVSDFAINLLNKWTLTWNKNLKVRFNVLEGLLGSVGTLAEKNE